MARLRVRVSAGAKRTEFAGESEGELRVRVAAPAREGRANRELLAFLAKQLEVPPSRVSLFHGASSRHKVVEVDGMSVEEVRGRFHIEATPVQ